MTIELILAAANNQINKVYECLIRGDNVNFKENLYGDTPLHKTSICGNKSVLNIMLHYNDNLSIPNNQCFTVYDIHNVIYHRFLDRQFEKQQEESLDLMGSSNVEDNYYYFSDDYGYTV